MRGRRGQATRPQDKPVDDPTGPWLDHRSSADAFGLTRFACQTAVLNLDQQQDGQDSARQQRRELTALDAPVGDLVRTPGQKRPAVTSWP
jgi:hypothetical protein